SCGVQECQEAFAGDSDALCGKSGEWKIRMRSTSKNRIAPSIAIILLAVGIIPGTTMAAEREDVCKALIKLAELLEKNDKADTAKQASAIAESLDSIDEVMYLMSRRRGTKGGMGVGDKPGAITPDGIEAKITDLAKKELTNERLAKEAKAIQRMAHITVAIAEVTKHKSPPLAKKYKQIWLDSTEEMRRFSVDLARAAEKKDAKALREAAQKIDASCNKCHQPFQDCLPVPV